MISETIQQTVSKIAMSPESVALSPIACNPEPKAHSLELSQNFKIFADEQEEKAIEYCFERFAEFCQEAGSIEEQSALEANLLLKARRIRSHLQESGFRLKGKPEIETWGIPRISAVAGLPMDITLASGDNYQILLFQKKEFLWQLEGCLYFRNFAWGFLKNQDIKEIEKYSPAAAKLFVNYRARFCEDMDLGTIPDEAVQIRQALKELDSYMPLAELAKNLEGILTNKLALPFSLQEKLQDKIWPEGNYPGARALVKNAKFEAEKKIILDIRKYKNRERLLQDWARFYSIYRKKPERSECGVCSRLAEAGLGPLDNFRKFKYFRGNAERLLKYELALGNLELAEKNYGGNLEPAIKRAKLASSLIIAYINNNLEQIKKLCRIHLPEREHNKEYNLCEQRTQRIRRNPEYEDKSCGNITAIYFDTTKEVIPKALLSGEFSNGSDIYAHSVKDIEGALCSLYLLNKYPLLISNKSQKALKNYQSAKVTRTMEK